VEFHADTGMKRPKLVVLLTARNVPCIHESTYLAESAVLADFVGFVDSCLIKHFLRVLSTTFSRTQNQSKLNLKIVGVQSCTESRPWNVRAQLRRQVASNKSPSRGRQDQSLDLLILDLTIYI
jgi:hypothetical protein